MTRWRRIRVLLWCRLLDRHRDNLEYVGHNIFKACQDCHRPGVLHMSEIEAWRGILSWTYRRGGEHEVAVDEAPAAGPAAGPAPGSAGTDAAANP